MGKIKTMQHLNKDADEKVQVFASYHWTSKNGKLNGFGNWMGQFDKAAYTNNPREFLLDMERTISNLLTEKLQKEVQVRILYFR